MRNVILAMLIGFSVISLASADLESDYVIVQAENIQLTADYSQSQKEADLYKRLYEKEQFWANVKDVVILVAIIL